MTPYVEVEGIRLFHAECREGLSRLASGCAEAVVTDPPWNLGMPYGAHDDDLPAQRYRSWLREVVAQCHRLGAATFVYLPGRHHLGSAATTLEPWFRVRVVWIWRKGPADPQPVLVAVREDRPPAAAPTVTTGLPAVAGVLDAPVAGVLDAPSVSEAGCSDGGAAVALHPRPWPEHGHPPALWTAL